MARKIRLVVLAGLMLAALLALMLPLVLSSEPMRKELAERLGYHLESEISLDSIELAWLPVPHLLVRQVAFQRPELQLSLPEIHVFPSFRALRKLRLEPRRVLLSEPALRLDPTATLFAEPSAPPRIFPRNFKGVVEITGGTVTIAETGGVNKIDGIQWLRGVSLAELHFSGIEATMGISPQRLQLVLEMLPSFGQHLTLEGYYQADGVYDIQADGRALRLHEVLTSPVLGVAPIEAMTNLKLDAAGVGLRQIEATLHGELPCFLVSPEELTRPTGAVRLDCGVIDLSLSRKEDDWRVLINDFEIKEPRMRLHGEVSRQASLEKSPYWNLELHGSDLSADEIMPAVVELFGEYLAARKVGEIVLGGHAAKASFLVSGSEEELREPISFSDRMFLALEVERAEIMVPEIDLHLPEASGYLKIENSILELRRAKARHGRSHGREGSLRVGLRSDLPLLELELELAADLEDLRKALPVMVDHPVFQAEMARFPQAEGEVTGRLAVGDNWHDFTVDIYIERGQGLVTYDRLPWPITPHRGRLLIDREQVRWREVAATVGPHQLAASSGRIDLTSEAPFVVEEASAELDSGALFAHLLTYPPLAEALPPVLSEIDGPVRLVAGQAEGKLFQPAQWRYRATVELDEHKTLNWYSPLLATAVTSSGGRLLIDQEQVVMEQLAMKLHDSAYALESRLEHQNLQNWQGKLKLGGRLTPANRDWLRQRQWLPASLLPRAPIHLKPLEFAWDEEQRQLEVVLQADDNRRREQPPPLAINLRQRKQAMQLEALVAEPEHGHRARLRLDLPRQDSSPYPPDSRRGESRLENLLPPMSGTFTGELRAGVLGHYFDFFAKRLEPGNWQGEGEFSTDRQVPSFSGQLEIQDLSWSPEPDGPPWAIIKNFSLAGQEQDWQLRKLEVSLPPDQQFDIAQQFDLAGEIKASKQGLVVDLELSSPHLRRQTLTKLYQEIKRQQPQLEVRTEPQHWPVTGRLGFHLDEFDSGPWLAEREDISLRWQPMAGQLSLTPETGLVFELQGAELCCLEIGGTWYPDPELGTSSFTLASACPETTRFEKILPCLGIEQDIITGDCLLNAQLQGDFAHWQEGRISITSPEGGRILRMGLLARIFSLVNLTDIFTGTIAGLDERGFAYRELEFEGVIEEHVLTIEKAVLRGEGLNLIARGKLNLDDLQADMVILVAPFKTIDTIVSWIPFIGRIIGGEDAAVVTIPVGVKGDIRDPQLTVMSPDAVGEGLLRLLRSTLMLPFNILSPILPGPDSDPDSEPEPTPEPADDQDNSDHQDGSSQLPEH